MDFLLRIVGPATNREVLIAEGSELTLGRDAGTDVPLADPEKLISRRHLTVRASSSSLDLVVVSSVNDVETSRGTLVHGGRGSLAGGDHFSIGAYRIDIVANAAAGGAAMAPAAPWPLPVSAQAPAVPDDPFAALFGSDAAAPASQHPLDHPDFRPAPSAPVPTSGEDPFAALLGKAPSPAPAPQAAGFAATAGAPLAGTGGGGLLDEFLGGSHGRHAASNPLADILGRADRDTGRAFSPDHVHGIAMPAPFQVSAQPPRDPPPQQVSSAPAPASGSDDDAWAALLQSAAPTAPAEPATVVTPPARSAPVPEAEPTEMIDIGLLAPAPKAPPPVTPPPKVDDDPFGAMFGDGSDGDDVFRDWPTVQPPQSSEAPPASSATTPTRYDPEVADAPTLVSPLSAAIPPAPARPGAQQRPPATAPSAAPGTSAQASGAWTAFARGLGLPATLSEDPAAAERVGTMVRMVIEGLTDLLAARADLKRELRADDRTMLAGRDNNPLKLKLSAQEVVQYLFSAHSGIGYMAPDRAVQESVNELRVHEGATVAAVRAAVEGTLREFDPARLKKKPLAGVKSGPFQFLDNAKLWDAYEQYYDKQSQQMADWLEKMFNSHFMPAYSKETERLKMLLITPPTHQP